MQYINQPTHVLEKEYNRLCYMNISLLSKDVIETIWANINAIAAILYNRQQENCKLTK